jgi:hypothetical protein
VSTTATVPTAAADTRSARGGEVVVPGGPSASVIAQTAIARSAHLVPASASGAHRLRATTLVPHGNGLVRFISSR